MNLILLGAPGSGKGTQAKLLERELGVTHISTGDILRRAVAEGTPLGQEAQRLMSAGQLVPDRVMIELVRERLGAGVKGGFLLDGFPRTVDQAQGLDQMLADSGERIDHVLAIQVPREELMRRLLERARLEGRNDDTAEVIARRLEVYENQTVPVADWYRRRSILVEVDGGRTVEQVLTDIRGRLQPAPGVGR
jgi:adenylate kinase